MQLKIKIAISTFLVMLSLLCSKSLYAHVMVAQHGTLNVTEDGVYMVISLPVSAFSGIDDDLDGKLSAEEFATHRLSIIDTVHSKITLKDESGKLALQGIILSPVTDHHSPKAPASQLVVMGRYTLIQPNSQFEYQVSIFGQGSAEKSLEIIATKKIDGRKQVVELSPKQSNVLLFKE
tara:strand:+ start:5756 stop:6289 length:534 start_codon:yes stop_codon:yes gene_type:complete